MAWTNVRREAEGIADPDEAMGAVVDTLRRLLAYADLPASPLELRPVDTPGRSLLGS